MKYLLFILAVIVLVYVLIPRNKSGVSTIIYYSKTCIMENGVCDHPFISQQDFFVNTTKNTVSYRGGENNTTIVSFDDCKVIDRNNWSCGNGTSEPSFSDNDGVMEEINPVAKDLFKVEQIGYFKYCFYRIFGT